MGIWCRQALTTELRTWRQGGGGRGQARTLIGAGDRGPVTGGAMMRDSVGIVIRKRLPEDVTP